MGSVPAPFPPKNVGSAKLVNSKFCFQLCVDYKDKHGNTPLHLAVRSVELFPNTRAIKELLIKGASRTITDENGLKPFDLIDEIDQTEDNENLREELR